MIRSGTVSLVAAAVAATACAAVGGAAGTADPGVTARRIVIGGTSPAPGAAAYFRYVNANGGVLGRKIVYRYSDDRGDPGRTIVAVRELVQQDEVFALFNLTGTTNNLAVREFLNAQRVPQLFVASGHTSFGFDYRRYPYTMGYAPSHRAEGAVYARYLARSVPKARIAVLYEDGEDGRDLFAALRRGLGGSARMIAKAVAFDPTQPRVEEQVAKLRQTEAEIFAIFASGKFAAEAAAAARRLQWRPQVVVSAAAAAAAAPPAGAITAVFLRDPADPAWADDPGMELFRRLARRYVRGERVSDRSLVAGMAPAFTLVEALERAGRNPTRARLMQAATTLADANNPFLLPGIVVKTSRTDRFPIEQLQLARWNGRRWIRFGGLVSARS